MSFVEGFIVGPPSITCAPSSEKSLSIPAPETTASTPVRGVAKASLALRDLLAHVGDVLALDRADAVEDGSRGAGVVGVDMDLEGRLVADDQNRVADLLESGHVRRRGQALAQNDEVDAVAVLGLGVVDVREASGRVVLDLGQRHGLAGERRERAADDHDQPERPRVDDACLGEDLELLGRVAKRLFAGEEGGGEHLGQECVLLVGRGFGFEVVGVPVGAALPDRLGHRARDGQHRALGRLTDRCPRGVGRVRERGLDHLGVDQPPRGRRELLGGATDDLAQDHAGVAPSAHQRRSRDGADDLGALGIAVDRCLLEAVELVDHVAQGQRHVVARVAVRDWEHVQVVDLLAPLLEVRIGDGDDRTKALNGGISHRGREHIPGGAEKASSKKVRSLDQSQTWRKVSLSPASAIPKEWRGARRRSVGLPGLKI